MWALLAPILKYGGLAWSGVTTFFKRRPIAILYVVLAVVAALVYWQHRETVSENLQLRSDIVTLERAFEDQVLAADAALQRSEDIAAALIEYQITVESLENTSRDLRRRNAQLAQRIEDLDLEVRIEQDPSDAGIIASSLYNDFVRLRECRTDPSADGTCEITPDPATDLAATGPSRTD